MLIKVSFFVMRGLLTHCLQITRHVAEIIQRQEFICKLARAMMMFGGPSHRLQAQIQATAKVLEVELYVQLSDFSASSFSHSIDFPGRACTCPI